MIPSYERTLELVKLMDAQFSAMSSSLDRENKAKSQLTSNISQVKSYISTINHAIKVLTDRSSANTSVEETEKFLRLWWGQINATNGISGYISEAEHLVSIVNATSQNSVSLKKTQAAVDAQIARVKSHKDYKTWVKNADKLNFDILPNAMPQSLEEYTQEALDMLIAYGARVLWEPYKRYMFYNLYIIYKQEIRATNERQDRIKRFDEVTATADSLIPKWIVALNTELQSQERKLAGLEATYQEFESKAHERLMNIQNQLDNDVVKKYVPDEWNTWLENYEKTNVSWNSVKAKTDISTVAREEFTLNYLNGSGKTNLGTNKYVMGLAKRYEAHFHKLLKIQGNTMFFRFPLQMHLDTLRYRFSVDMHNVTEGTRGNINGIVQSFVSTTVANMPVGKVKLIFGDPSNTGVFSNFRDVGKNDSEGSRLCTYIVDVDGIRKELERLSNEIGYTINNILKGTKTTLYQHNKERAFNSSPYVFLFLMDYPQNMTAQSLQALKNIVENGPKCGIFTFIFNVAGTSMQLLRPEEKRLAEEIAASTFTFSGGKVLDKHGSYLTSGGEISTAAFDTFVKFYNEAIKDSQQLTVKLDELDGNVCSNGEYKIPIGKNLGGETEYMAFFGSCQDYLMSGATRIGKTNALHVIIYNTLKYVPNAELYLVDFKQGVEFAPYAGLNHPAVKALAVESVPEFGYAVLRHIEDKIKAISELFISHSVKNWREYYEATGKVIPVTIVILDEFQHLFDTEVGKDCARIIEVIAKEGGAFNVHIILSTQSISNVNGLTPAAKDNIFGRMVFYHSEREYTSMLWNDSHLAMTLSSEIKGQMVFATGDKNSQRLLQWALAKPANDVVKEMSYPIAQGRYQTKLLLSTIRENPFSIFNAIINGKYAADESQPCEITIGNEVDVFAGELRKQLEDGKSRTVDGYYEHSYLKLQKKANENILFAGGTESIAEGCFQLSIYCALARMISLGRKHSVVVLAPELAAKITNICDAFKDYIDFYDQESDLSEIVLENKEFMFVFGLQNFRSLSYQPDVQLTAARNDAARPKMPGGFMPHQTFSKSSRTDGQLFQEVVESDRIHVIAWHNNVQNLATMFGGTAKVQDFLYSFVHKVGFKMPDKNDSKLFINSEACVDLSAQAAVYVKMNRERVIRPYKAMDNSYCADLNEALKKAEGVMSK